METTKERYVPQDFIVAHENALGVVYRHPTELKAIAYRTKSKKRSWFYRFINENDMNKRIDHFFNFLLEREAEKEQRKRDLKLEKAQAKEQIKVGDIFVSSWGYDQTNVNFFQIVEIEGAYMYMRELKSDRVKIHSGMSDEVVALPDQFYSDHILKKQISFNPKVSQCAWANLWDGMPKYRSWYA